MHAQQHRGDGGQCRANHEGQSNDVVGVDAQQVGHFHVFGAGAAGAAHSRAGDEQGQAGHGQQGDDEHHDLHVGNKHFLRTTGPERQAAGQQVGDGKVAGTLRKLNRVLQKDRHADRRNQWNQTVAVAQWPIGHTLDAVSVCAGYDDRCGKAGNHQQRQAVNPQHRQTGECHEGHIGTDHVHLAMSEVDHPNDAVHHCVADGDQCICTANGQAIDQLLHVVEKLGHLPRS